MSRRVRRPAAKRAGEKNHLQTPEAGAREGRLQSDGGLVPGTGAAVSVVAPSRAAAQQREGTRRPVSRGSRASTTAPFAGRMRGYIGRAREDTIWRAALESFLIAGAIVLALVPAWNIWTIISGTGADNPSNDYVGYSSLLNQILGGSYSWQNYFHDTMIGIHSLAIPFLVRLAIIELTHWNIYWELYVGLLAAALRVVFLFDALTRLVRRPARWVLLPVLAALAFSTSQVSVFGYGDASLTIELTQLGLAVGVWGLARFRGRWPGVAIGVTGGALATLSGGGGLPIWPVFLAGMFLLGFRQIRQYIVFVAGALLASMPYLLYTVAQPTGAPLAGTSLFNWQFIVAAIGWPFSESFSLSTATTVGYTGICLALAGLVLLWLRGGRRILLPAAPALMMLAYGAINTWAISYYRGVGQTGLAPWYTTHFLPVWIGLAGLAYVLRADSGPPALTLPGLGRSALAFVTTRLWPLTLIGILALVYFTSNLTETDKAMYLYSRAPASASCLRNYLTAPTTCEGTLFQWGVGRPVLIAKLAAPLARYHLSVFAPDEEWALQGDYGLSSVQVREAAVTPPITWASSSGDPAPWQDYHHLNLQMPASDSLYWTVTLPRNVTEATFHSAVAVGAGGPSGQNVRFTVAVLPSPPVGSAARQVFAQTVPSGDQSWHSVTLGLAAYAGHAITLQLGAAGGPPGTSTLWQYPVIDVHLTGGAPNTPAWSGPPDTAADLRLDGGSWGAWSTLDLQPAAGQSDTWNAGPHPTFSYRGTLNACVADYAELELRMSIPQSGLPSTLSVIYQYRVPHSGQTIPTGGQIVIPLYADGQLHTYRYSLKLLQLPVGARLTGLSLSPIYTISPGEVNSIRMTSLRLIRTPWPTSCA